jgi:hypothetical protein
VSAVGVVDTGAVEFNSDILHIREVDTDIVNKIVNNDDDMKNTSPYGGGLEYIHLSLASRRRRRKGKPVPRCITGPVSH